MKAGFLIAKTELLMIKQDKRILSAVIVLNFLMLTSILFGYNKDEDFSVLLIFFLLSYSLPSLIVADLTAGERERKTLETLVISCRCRESVLLGKFLTVLIFSLIPLNTGLLLLLTVTTVWQTLGVFLKVLPFSCLVSVLLTSNGIRCSSVRAAKGFESMALLLVPLVSFFMSGQSSVWFYAGLYIVSGLLVWMIYNKTAKYFMSEKVFYP